MNRRWTAWLAWGLVGLCLALIGALILLARVNHTTLSRFVADESFSLVFASVFPVIGALVASRHPRNAVGWLMIAAPFFSIYGSVLDGYSHRALLVSPGSLPGGALASWLAIWSWIPMLSLALLLILLL